MRAVSRRTLLVIVVVAVGALVVAAVSPTRERAEPGVSAAPSGGRLGVDWYEVPGNPILAGRCFGWRCAGAADPAIARRDDGRLDLWFTTMGIRVALTGLEADGPWIGHAIVDAGAVGKAEVVPESPVVGVDRQGAWDRYVETISLAHAHPAAARVAAYLGYAERGGKTGFVAPALGLMRAEDSEGRAWTRMPEPIYRPRADAWDGIFLTGPSVLRGPDGVWRLYYTGAGKRFGIGLLTSDDGERWTAHPANPLLEARPGEWDDQLIEAAVVHHDGRYWMWYSGYRGALTKDTSIAIGLATSDDGVRWTRHPDNPILKPGPPGSWNDLRVLAPDVLVEPDGSLLMAAYGSSRADIGKSSGSIGLWRSRR